MTATEVRNWIGKYFLYVLGGIGGYIFIFAGSVLLPIQREEALAAAETIVPVFLGQLTIMYNWFFSQNAKDEVRDIRVPEWLIKGPPVMGLVLIILTLLAMILGNSNEENWAPHPETFRRVVVFVVSLLNVTTIIVIGRYFGNSKQTTKQNN